MRPRGACSPGMSIARQSKREVLGESHLTSSRTAEQDVDRDVDGLSLDVPQSDLYSAERTERTGIVGVQQGLEFRQAAARTVLDVERVSADQPRSVVDFDDRAELDRNLPQPDDPRVGLDLQNGLACTEVGAGGPSVGGLQRNVDPVDPDGADLHMPIPISARHRRGPWCAK